MRNDTILILADPAEPQLRQLEKSLAGVNIIAGNSAEVLAPAAAHATVLFNWSGSLVLFRKIFGNCPNLRWVHSRSVGLERTLFPELLESPVPLTNGTGVFSASLGEFVLAAILYFAKDFRRLIRNQQAGVWEDFEVMPVSGHTVGIIGYGDIGRAVAARVRPLGMTVLAVKRHTSPLGGTDPMVEQTYSPDRRLQMLSRCDYVVVAEDRLDMLSRCDYVVVAVPWTEQTRGLIADPEFAVMRKNAVVINVGRGPVIKEEALVRALSSGRIKGAALDVFDQEPLPRDHHFYKLDNVLLSPHCADHTPDWLDQAMEFFIAQFERFRKDEPLLNVVDKKLGY